MAELNTANANLSQQLDVSLSLYSDARCDSLAASACASSSGQPQQTVKGTHEPLLTEDEADDGEVASPTESPTGHVPLPQVSQPHPGLAAALRAAGGASSSAARASSSPANTATVAPKDVAPTSFASSRRRRSEWELGPARRERRRLRAQAFHASMAAQEAAWQASATAQAEWDEL